MKPITAHILAFSKNAWMTLNGFEAAVKLVKQLGYTSLVVIPVLFIEQEMTKEAIANIAKKHGIKLVVCGFYTGAEKSPYSNEGMQSALEELTRQFSWQVYFVQQGVGKNLVCGPNFDNWRASKDDFNLAGLKKYALAITRLAEKLSLVVCVEILNVHESSIPAPHEVIPALIHEIGSPHLKLHPDFVHIESYIGAGKFIEFLLRHKDIIGTIELGMPGRRSMKHSNSFQGIMAGLFHTLRTTFQDTPLSVEQFDYIDVIEPFGLPEVYSSRMSGVDVLHDDTAFLKCYGLMEAPAVMPSTEA